MRRSNTKSVGGVDITSDFSNLFFQIHIIIYDLLNNVYPSFINCFKLYEFICYLQ